jgi:hypothetical protein
MVIISKIPAQKTSSELITLVSFKRALLRSSGQYSARVNRSASNHVRTSISSCCFAERLSGLFVITKVVAILSENSAG